MKTIPKRKFVKIYTGYKFDLLEKDINDSIATWQEAGYDVVDVKTAFENPGIDSHDGNITIVILYALL